MKEHYHHFNATKTITEYVKGKSKMQKVKKKDILQKIVRQAQRKQRFTYEAKEETQAGQGKMMTGISN